MTVRNLGATGLAIVEADEWPAVLRRLVASGCRRRRYSNGNLSKYTVLKGDKQISEKRDGVIYVETEVLREAGLEP